MYILTPTLAGGLSGLYKFYEELYRWLDWIIFRHYPEIICLVFDQLKIFERKISVLKKNFSARPISNFSFVQSNR